MPVLGLAALSGLAALPLAARPSLLVGALVLGVVFGWVVGMFFHRRSDRAQDEIKKSKRQLQAIFDGITDGLIIVDRDFRVVAVNKAEAAFLGSKPQELVGKPCYEVYCRGDVACEGCPAHQTFATGKPARRHPGGGRTGESVHGQGSGETGLQPRLR